MTFNFKPQAREKTPLIIGIAGPTKSGKTKSALRLATGIAKGGTIAMFNAEGARGHQYADQYKYIAADIQPPFAPDRYTEALKEAAKIKPAVLIIDSASHMHDGPGGMLDMHEQELDRIAGNDFKKRDRVNFTAWIKPKALENEFIYQMLSMDVPIILCFRAKEKIKIVPGKEPIDLGWQPISSDRVAFETIFTLMLPPNSKGVPDLSLSQMREPFDQLVPAGKQIDEKLGLLLANWSEGVTKNSAPGAASDASLRDGAGVAESMLPISPEQIAHLEKVCDENKVQIEALLNKAGISKLADMKSQDFQKAVSWVIKHSERSTAAHTLSE